MAGHGESEKKSSDAVNDLQTFRAENLQSNMKVIYYRFVSITQKSHGAITVKFMLKCCV